MISGTSWELPDMIGVNRYILGMYFEGIVFTISIIFWILMITKWIQKRTRLPSLLVGAYLGFLIMLGATFIEKVLVTNEIYTYTRIVYENKIGGIGAIGSLIFIVFFTWFVYELFFQDFRRMAILLKVYAIIALLLILYAIIFMIIDFPQEMFDVLFLPLSSFSILMLIPIFILSIVKSFTIAKKVSPAETAEEKAQLISLKTIGYNSLILLLFVLLFGIDVAVPSFGMTLLYFIAWSLMLISFSFAYIGYFNPTWLRQFVKK